jgi:hypothetical protein
MRIVLELSTDLVAKVSQNAVAQGLSFDEEVGTLLREEIANRARCGSAALDIVYDQVLRNYAASLVSGTSFTTKDALRALTIQLHQSDVKILGRRLCAAARSPESGIIIVGATASGSTIFKRV